MKHLTQGFAVILTLIFGLSGPVADPAEAQTSVQKLLEDVVVGDEKAPVTIIEYASLGCPHCKTFHTETLPKIKKKYIDTGKVKLIFRDFPLGTPALAASMIARCSGPARFHGMIEILFRDQAVWSHGQNVLGSLQASAKKGGMSPKQVDDCLRNEALMIGLRQMAEDARQKYGINSTPTFIVQGEKVAGALPYGQFEAIIERALK